jgi:hypothetical protein
VPHLEGKFTMSFGLPNLRSCSLFCALLLAIVRWTTDALAALHAKQSLTSNVTLDVFLILLIVGAIMAERPGNAIARPAISIALFAGLAAALVTAVLAFWRVWH